MSARHRSRAARATGNAGDVGLRETGAFLRELIEHGCLRIRMAVATQIAVAEVVGKDEDDVRLLGGREGDE